MSTIKLREAVTDRVLELGCGDAPRVHPRCLGGQDTTADVRACHLPDGRPCVDVVCSFEDPLPFAAGEFDCVFSMFAAEHISWRKTRQFFAECFRVVRPGGRAAFVLPNTEAQLRWVQARGWEGQPPRWPPFEEASCHLFGGNDYPENTHRAYLSPAFITDILTGAGFVDVRVTPYGITQTDMIVEARRPAAATPAGGVEWFKADGLPALVAEASALIGVLGESDRAPHLLEYLTGAPPFFNNFALVVRDINFDFSHWSRRWEYPWTMKVGDFRPGHRVLEAGGTGSIIPYRLAQLGARVTVLDVDPSRFVSLAPFRHLEENITFVEGDVRHLRLPDGAFDRVVCNSVLEHCPAVVAAGDGPLLAVEQLWRVTAPGGRLVVTLDVVPDGWCDEHNAVDDAALARLLRLLDLSVPDGAGAVTYMIGGHGPDGKGTVDLRVIGFWCDKK